MTTTSRLATPEDDENQNDVLRAPSWPETIFPGTDDAAKWFRASPPAPSTQLHEWAFPRRNPAKQGEIIRKRKATAQDLFLRMPFWYTAEP